MLWIVLILLILIILGELYTLALVTMYFVRHGDSKPEAKKGLEALEDLDAD